VKHKNEPGLSRFSAKGAEAEDVFIEDLRGVIWNSARDVGLNWKQIAGAARLSPKTVSRFAYRETKRPTFYTIFRILTVVGVRLTYVVANNQTSAEERKSVNS